jgi:hypothetical protein
MIEMLPAEFHLQLYRELREILPQLEARERADQEAKERKENDRIKRVRRAYDTAIERQKETIKRVQNTKYQTNKRTSRLNIE